MLPSGHALPVARPPQTFLPWIQALRALAAASVAFSHVEYDAVNNGGDPSGVLTAIMNFMPWVAGVDIFFVISGFVIVHASASLFGAANGPWIFLRRRLARIVPLYWIVTSFFLLILLLDRHEIHGDIGSPLYCFASYLFIPMIRPDGMVQPAYGLGWTLNYEMFFYLVFTPFLLLTRYKAVGGAVALLSFLVLAGQLIHFHNVQVAYWSNLIILEFCAGMVIALVFARGFRLPEWLRPVLIAVAIVALHLNAGRALDWRALAFGIPATLMVGAACLGRSPSVLNRLERWLVRLGDASYAMYLIHPFVIRSFTILWRHLHLTSEFGGIMYVVVVLAVAQSCALLINQTLERRIALFFRRTPAAA
ncbi:MAG: acyltransferase [Acidocella sp.]|nr:acyltransferase [Acidocella sp.]